MTNLIKKKEVDFEMKKNNKFNIQTKRKETMWNGNGMLNLVKEMTIDKFDKKFGSRNYETVKFNNQTKRNEGIMNEKLDYVVRYQMFIIKSQSVSQSVYYAQKSAS